MIKSILKSFGNGLFFIGVATALLSVIVAVFGYNFLLDGDASVLSSIYFRFFILGLKIILFLGAFMVAYRIITVVNSLDDIKNNKRLFILLVIIVLIYNLINFLLGLYA
jgi:hypothetical protein